MAQVDIFQGIPVERAQVFVVDFRYDGPFDTALFDEYVGKLRDPKYPLEPLKWVARGSGRLFFFPQSYGHSVMNYKLECIGEPGPLNAAGYLDTDTSEGVIRRLLCGYSVSLNRILPREKSDLYKKEVIKPALEPHFEVS